LEATFVYVSEVVAASAASSRTSCWTRRSS